MKYLSFIVLCFFLLFYYNLTAYDNTFNSKEYLKNQITILEAKILEIRLGIEDGKIELEYYYSWDMGYLVGQKIAYEHILYEYFDQYKQ